MSLRRVLLIGLGGIWTTAVVTGLSSLWAYASMPAPASPVATTWPAATGLPRAKNGPTLIVFAHPKCPCSRASVGELARLMTHVQGRVETVVAFYRPSSAADDWEKTDLWDAAAAIPHVRVVTDTDGQEAQTFGVLASGHTLLYDASGRLLFSGGITAARGHAGDNPGSGSIVALVLGSGPSVSHTNVFGCFLRAIDVTAPAPSRLD